MSIDLTRNKNENDPEIGGIHNVEIPIGTGGGLYIHIPFCKQACHYCDFHFSTSLRKKGQMVEMLCKELYMRQGELPGKDVQTIYLGGGTPSLLSAEEIDQLFSAVYSNYKVAPNAEVTLEANPDDLTREKLEILQHSPVNRLSIGVQSFFEEDLTMMHRAHNAREALDCIKMAREYFDNISIDLIYGIPGMTSARWKENIDIALDLGLPHFSCYALTVEPHTALKKFIEKGLIQPVDDEAAREHFEILTKTLKDAGFVHYEFSNFGKPGYFSQNNTAYWMGIPYLGIGPSAHSYDGERRQWNVSNNSLYIKSIEKGELPAEVENLNLTDKYNEYVMTRLRTMWGISLVEVKQKFGTQYQVYLLLQAKPLVEAGVLKLENEVLQVTEKGKFLSDGISADLFMINMKQE